MKYPSAHFWCYLINAGFHFLSLWPSTRDVWLVLTSALCAGSSKFWVVLPGWCNQGPACAPVISNFLWCSNFGSHLFEMVWLQVVEVWLHLGVTWTTCLRLGISGKQNWAKSLKFLGLFLWDNLTYSAAMNDFPFLSQNARWNALYDKFLFQIIDWMNFLIKQRT